MSIDFVVGKAKVLVMLELNWEKLPCSWPAKVRLPVLAVATSVSAIVSEYLPSRGPNVSGVLGSAELNTFRAVATVLESPTTVCDSSSLRVTLPVPAVTKDGEALQL